MTTIGTVLLILGYLFVLACSIWMIILAFRTSVLWGLGMFVPLVPLVFLVKYWDEAKRPFLWNLAGAGLVGLGAVLVAVSAPARMPPELPGREAAETFRNEPLERPRRRNPGAEPQKLEDLRRPKTETETGMEAEPMVLGDRASTLPAGTPTDRSGELGMRRPRSAPALPPGSRASVALDRRTVPLAEAPSRIGSYVEVETFIGKVVRGRLVEAGEQGLVVQITLGGGSMTVPVAAARVLEIRLLDR